MIYDIDNLKVDDYVRVDTDANFRLPKAIIAKYTMARVCTLSLFSGGYIGLPDNLRLIYRDGKYVGWYHAE